MPTPPTALLPMLLLFAGQSNMSGYSPMVILKNAAIASPYVYSYDRTPANEWIGAAAQSVGGTTYLLPTLAANPCKYLENVSGTLGGAVDDWGTYDKHNPTATAQNLVFGGTTTGGTFTITYTGQSPVTVAFSSTFTTLAANIKDALEAVPAIGRNSIDVVNVSFGGSSGTVKVVYYGNTIGRSTVALSVDGSGLTGTSPTLTRTSVTTYGSAGLVGSYGPELSFLTAFRAAYPTVPLLALKQSLGGTSLRGDWLPYTVQLGTAQAGSSNTITLASGDFGTSVAYKGLYLKILSGPGAGQVNQIASYNATTKVATMVDNWTTQPTSSSTYGIERLQCQILRLMITQAAARNDALYGSGNWEYGPFVWMQGESGAHSAGTAADDSTYRSDLRAFRDFIRSITRADLPFIIGRIGNNWGWETSPNTYLDEVGYPYAAIDASATNDGRVATNSTNRTNFLAGAVARRASQLAVAGDTNCNWYSNDDLPIRPPFWQAHTTFNGGVTNSDLYAYHFAHPGNLTAGERAFAAYQSLVGGGGAPAQPDRTRLRVSGAGVRVNGAELRLT